VCIYLFYVQVRPLTDEDWELCMRWRAHLALPLLSTLDLQEHILKVWRRIKESTHVYKCVQSLAFLKARAPALFCFRQLLEVARAPNARTLDVGCAFGQETRHLILEGAPPAGLVCADLHKRYWEAGCQVYGDDQKSAGPLDAVITVFGASPLFHSRRLACFDFLLPHSIPLQVILLLPSCLGTRILLPPCLAVSTRSCACKSSMFCRAPRQSICWCGFGGVHAPVDYWLARAWECVA
jgi:hypothetical protein